MRQPPGRQSFFTFLSRPVRRGARTPGNGARDRSPEDGRIGSAHCPSRGRETAARRFGRSRPASARGGRAAAPAITVPAGRPDARCPEAVVRSTPGGCRRLPATPCRPCSGRCLAIRAARGADRADPFARLPGYARSPAWERGSADLLGTRASCPRWTAVGLRPLAGWKPPLLGNPTVRASTGNPAELRA